VTAADECTCPLCTSQDGTSRYLWRNGQWGVRWGALTSTIFHYVIDASRLAEPFWIEHIAGKSRAMDLDEFIEAYRVALKLHDVHLDDIQGKIGRARRTVRLEVEMQRVLDRMCAGRSPRWYSIGELRRAGNEAEANIAAEDKAAASA
jgi:hypothetical protein